MNGRYSVLMSVYSKERPEYLRAAMDSMFGQTVPPDDFVLVCDGPLTEELDQVIGQMQASHESLNVVRLKENGGLGRALNIGLECCKNELVARMDSDDISFPDRCERQLEYMAEHPDVSVLSGTVLEFCQTIETITGQRKLPADDEELKAFSHRRCPFNHPAVMFRKDSVKAAGGYQEKYHRFEDYYLWVRMFRMGNKGHNMEAPVLYMRVHDNLYMRRGGVHTQETFLRSTDGCGRPAGRACRIIFLAQYRMRWSVHCPTGQEKWYTRRSTSKRKSFFTRCLTGA